MTRPHWKSVADQHKAENIRLTSENEVLQAEIAEAKKQLVSANQEHDSEKLEWQQSISAKEAEFLAEKKALNAEQTSKQTMWEAEKNKITQEIGALQKDVKSKQSQITKMELRKMASAYSKQEDEYATNALEWSKYLLLSVLILAVSTIWSIWWASGRQWYDRFEFYLVDFILISAVWFSASQYSHYMKLRHDYANRKTLAQTYHNILLSISETTNPSEIAISTETKQFFMQKAMDVFCSPSIIDTREPLLTKEVVKNIATLAGQALKNKL